MFRSNSRVWAELHEKAFRRLGGVTRVVVLDNLREVVLTPDIYEPTLNPLYRDMLQHYGVTALPSRVQDPDDTRIHGTTKRQVAVMFAEERSALFPLPLEPFRYYDLKRLARSADAIVYRMMLARKNK